MRPVASSTSRKAKVVSTYWDRTRTPTSAPNSVRMASAAASPSRRAASGGRARAVNFRFTGREKAPGSSRVSSWVIVP